MKNYLPSTAAFFLSGSLQYDETSDFESVLSTASRFIGVPIGQARDCKSPCSPNGSAMSDRAARDATVTEIDVTERRSISSLLVDSSKSASFSSIFAGSGDASSDAVKKRKILF